MKGLRKLNQSFSERVEVLDHFDIDTELEVLISI